MLSDSQPVEAPPEVTNADANENQSFPQSPFSVKSEFDVTDRPSSQSPFALPLFPPSRPNSVPRPEIFQLVGSSHRPDSETSSRSSVDGKRDAIDNTQIFRKNEEQTSDDSSEESISDEGAIRRPSISTDPDTLSQLRVADAARGRLANIRRESSCSVDSEISHERLFKATQKVSAQWEDLAIDENERRNPDGSGSVRRNNSLSEPISVSIVNAFLPHSCSPSPTRYESAKQCYSPSTHTFVRSSMPYSPSPSPTRSPTRNRLMRFEKLRSQSPSPIAVPTRSLKRRMNDPFDSEAKRSCSVSYPRSATSPLVGDRPFPFPVAIDFTQPSTSMLFTQPRKPEMARRISVEFSPSSRDADVPSDVEMPFDSFVRPLSTESCQTDGNGLSVASGIDTNPPTPMSSFSGICEPISSIQDETEVQIPESEQPDDPPIAS